MNRHSRSAGLRRARAPRPHFLAPRQKALCAQSVSREARDTAGEAPGLPSEHARLTN